jgi:hypothetical protein
MARADKVWNTRFAGTLAGVINNRGYRVIGAVGGLHQAHRLAFLWVEGRWPKEIDHANGDKADNRWSSRRKRIIKSFQID